MWVIVQVLMSVGFTLYISFGKFTALFCNGIATKYRFTYAKKAILSSPE